MLNKMKLRTKAFGAMALAGASAFVSMTASAIDTAAVGTAITAAETDALTTGEFVIGTVASLVVIGLIIAIVKKI